MFEPLYQAARLARENSFSPFSRFKVGAALLTGDDRIIGGCNVENASYGLTLCAERVAIFKAVSEGIRTFQAICIVADTQNLTPPCGACRQIIWEFCGDIPVFLANLEGRHEEHRMLALLPGPFDARLLGVTE